LASLATHAAPEIRVALIKALATLGNSSVVSLLADFATSSDPAEQKAARQALIDLRFGPIAETLVTLLETSKPQVQSELARALGGRDDKAAVPKLLQLAERGPDSAHKAALEALALLVDPAQVLLLVNLVAREKTETARSDAALALNSACQRLQSRSGGFDPEPLVRAVKTGSTETRVALLPICSGLALPQVRAAMRADLADADPVVRTAAVRALCDTVDPELLGDVVSLAGATHDNSVKTLAINGAVRLARQDESARLPLSYRVGVFKSLLVAADRPEQKRMVLAGLEELPDPEALALVEPLLDDTTVQTEAARAAAKIAPTLPSKSATASGVVLKKALAATTDSATRQAVEAALQQVEAGTDYLTDWQASGPYRQSGKDYAALFDTVFSPELQTGETAKWQSLPAGTDPKRPGVMDLLKAFGGEQCVAYARTWLRSDQEGPAVLELGSDDGVKVWLNDKQVYALNIARPLQPGSDKVDLQLHSGWNLLLLKITQNNQGWEFCARLRKTDGTRFSSVQCEASPPLSAK
jgi:HEAT repeat protein